MSKLFLNKWTGENCQFSAKELDFKFLNMLRTTYFVVIILNMNKYFSYSSRSRTLLGWILRYRITSVVIYLWECSGCPLKMYIYQILRVKAALHNTGSRPSEMHNWHTKQSSLRHSSANPECCLWVFFHKLMAAVITVSVVQFRFPDPLIIIESNQILEEL